MNWALVRMHKLHKCSIRNLSDAAKSKEVVESSNKSKCAIRVLENSAPIGKKPLSRGFAMNKFDKDPSSSTMGNTQASNDGKHADVYTDGSCRNQGLANAKAGYGVYWGEGHPNNCSGAVSGHQDSNRSELRAAQQAIRTASKQGYSGVTIHSDSHYVRDAVANSANFQKAPAVNRDLRQSIHAMKSNVNVKVKHVKGHSGKHGNSQAHSLARAAAKK